MRDDMQRETVVVYFYLTSISDLPTLREGPNWPCEIGRRRFHSGRSWQQYCVDGEAVRIYPQCEIISHIWYEMKFCLPQCLAGKNCVNCAGANQTSQGKVVVLSRGKLPYLVKKTWCPHRDVVPVAKFDKLDSLGNTWWCFSTGKSVLVALTTWWWSESGLSVTDIVRDTRGWMFPWHMILMTLSRYPM